MMIRKVRKLNKNTSVIIFVDLNKIELKLHIILSSL